LGENSPVKEILVGKFVYIPHMKVGPKKKKTFPKKKKSFYILGYLLELIIKIWQFGKNKKNLRGMIKCFV
jgi:hypothetical protein